MKYTVIIQPSAKADLFEIHTWLLENAFDYADKWLWGITQAITSLANFPERCPISPESDAFDVTVRQLLYGKKPHVYRKNSYLKSKMNR
jgi:plasmid stabilization system protein ParE